jgi:hypothetical protein
MLAPELDTPGEVGFVRVVGPKELADLVSSTDTKLIDVRTSEDLLETIVVSE